MTNATERLIILHSSRVWNSRKDENGKAKSADKQREGWKKHTATSDFSFLQAFGEGKFNNTNDAEYPDHELVLIHT